MSRALPDSAAAMLALPHITRANYTKYGATLLAITERYALNKMGLLMQYQDELELGNTPDSPFQEDQDSDTDWGRLGAEAQQSTVSSYRGRGRGRSRGGVRKRFKRKSTSSAKKKAIRGVLNSSRGSKSKTGFGRGTTAGGSKLGSMPVPGTKPFNAKKLNL